MLKILIVDDSKSAQLKIHSILSQYGLCDQAYNGVEALEYFQVALAGNDLYDLVVMDIVMPKMNGIEAAKEIIKIQDRHNIPDAKRTHIIMLTGKTDPAHLMQAHFEAGVSAYLTKPFEDKTLIEAMNNMGLIEL